LAKQKKREGDNAEHYDGEESSKKRDGERGKHRGGGRGRKSHQRKLRKSLLRGDTREEEIHDPKKNGTLKRREKQK